LSGSSHECGGIKDVEKRGGVGIPGRVKERFGGRGGDGGELGKKWVFRVERRHWNFGCVGGGVNGATSSLIPASPCGRL